MLEEPTTLGVKHIIAIIRLHKKKLAGVGVKKLDLIISVGCWIVVIGVSGDKLVIVQVDLKMTKYMTQCSVKHGDHTVQLDLQEMDLILHGVGASLIQAGLWMIVPTVNGNN